MNRFLPITAALMLLSCAEAENGIDNPGDSDVVLVATASSHLAPQTRTAIGLSSQSDDIYIYWEANEKLVAYSAKDGFTSFVSTNQSSAPTADFTSSQATVVPDFAIYPYISGLTDPSEIHFTIEDSQEYTGLESISAYDFKYANSFAPQEDGSYHASFNQLNALIRCAINLNGLCEFAENEVLYSVEIAAENPLTGEMILDMSSSDPEISFGTSSTGLFLDVSGLNAAPDSPTVVYANAIPGEHLATEWFITITTADATSLTGEEVDPVLIRDVYFASKVKCDFQAGMYYTLPLKTEVINGGYHYDDNGNKVTGPEITEYDPEGGDDNSGEGGEGGDPVDPVDPVVPTGETANCYMISSPGTYAFNATVMGNGDAGIIAGAGFHTTSATISGGSSAELLWQDVAGFITSVSYDASTGVISYTAASNVGNACVALKNATGEILWSWHIWGTGDRAVEDHVYTNQAGSQFTVMDRNLGQLKMLYSSDLYTEGEPMYVKSSSGVSSSVADAVDPVYCTLYQWGRKDPVPSSGTMYDKDNTPTDISSSYPVLNYNNFSSADEATIRYSIQNPSYLIDTYQYTNSQLWEKDGNPYLWGGGQSTDYVSSMDDETAVAGWANGKTIYDPCPAGYRVANPYTWTGFIGGTAHNGTGADGNISLATSYSATYVDYDGDGVYSEDEKVTSWDSANDVPVVDGKEKLMRELRAVASYYEVTYTSKKWVIKNGDYILSSNKDTEGAVQCKYVTRYYAPVYCQGLFFLSDDNDSQGCYYPMISYRLGNSGAFYTSKVGYYWSSGQGSEAPAAYYLSIGNYEYKTSKTAGVNIKVDVFEPRSGKRDALPVRCVREQ